MKVGDRIEVVSRFDGADGCPVMATVTYIHPQRRYYEVEIDGQAPYYRKYRESFQFQYRRGNGE